MSRTPRTIGNITLVLALAACGSHLVLQAQLPQSVGSWAPAGPAADARTSAATVALADARSLVAGGLGTDGHPTDSVILYDATTGAVTSVGRLIAARIGHTATRLDDGRVLVTGGTVDGAVSSDVELFDPATGWSLLAASMAVPRTGHGAAKLADGRVLLVGGTTAGGEVLRSAEIFNPATAAVTPAAEGLQVARTGTSATTLIDGRVLVAGGNDGSSDLGSAEIYDPWSQTFAFATSELRVPRQGHTTLLLPHNNGVLVAGGTAQGQPVTAVDLFVPAEFPDPYSWAEGSFTTTGPLSFARAGATAGSAGEGFAVVLGGGSAEVEAYRFATIRSDKDDYTPGERAVITGSGWQPNEDVRLLFQEDPAVHDDYVLTVRADSQGNIFYDQWAPEHHDIGVRFYLTASDSRSRAQATFTDGNLSSTIDFSIGPAVVSPGATLDWTASAVCRDGGGPNTCESEGYVHGGAVQDSYTIRIERATNEAFTENVVLVASVPTMSGAAGGSFGAPTAGGPFFYRARHQNQSLANVPVKGTNPNSWQPASSSPVAVTVVVDTTAPVIVPDVTGTLGNNGWYTSDVLVSFTVVDDESAITSQSAACTSTTTIDADTSSTTVTCEAASAGGTASQSVTIKRDGSAPNAPGGVTAPAANPAGWHSSDVTVSFVDNGDNGPSGIASCSADSALTVETPGTDVTGTCTDNAGNTSSPATVTVKIDRTGPVITGSRAPLANASGWNNTPVVVSFVCADTGSVQSGIAVDTVAGNTLTTEGQNQWITSVGVCQDAAGNSAEPATVTGIDIDLTQPVITGHRTPEPNDFGWNNTDVTVSFECTDALSGVDVDTVQGATATSEGQAQWVTSTGDCVDKAGNAAAASTVSGINIDKSAPNAPTGTRTPPANAAGWNHTDVTVSFADTGDNGPSGVRSCTAPATVTEETPGTAVPGTCVDYAGNIGGATVVSVKLDKTSPTVDVLGVTAGAVYVLGAVPGATCSTTDALSGVLTPAALTVSGGVAPGVGTFTATCAGASDAAGNVTSPVSVSYMVQYAPQGAACFGQPGHVALQPINFTGASVFPKKGNSTVPVKFRVCGADGVSIGWSHEVVSGFVLYGTYNGTVSPYANEDVIELTSPDAAFRWSQADQQWIFNLGLKSFAAGNTYVFRIYLNDGSHIQFQFGIK